MRGNAVCYGAPVVFIAVDNHHGGLPVLEKIGTGRVPLFHLFVALLAPDIRLAQEVLLDADCIAHHVGCWQMIDSVV